MIRYRVKNALFVVVTLVALVVTYIIPVVLFWWGVTGCDAGGVVNDSWRVLDGWPLGGCFLLVCAYGGLTSCLVVKVMEEAYYKPACNQGHGWSFLRRAWAGY